MKLFTTHFGELRGVILLSLLVLVLGCVGSVRAGDFEAGNENYDAGKFGAAREAYEQMIARGEWSANVFYDLGNADFRLGEKGRAALNYERALALNPSHPEATANLRLVREQSGAHIAEMTWIDRLFPRVSADVYAVLGAIAVTALVAFLVLMFARGIGAGLWLGCIASLLLAGYAGTALWRDARDSSLAVIVGDKVEARLAPADRAGVAESLPPGSRVRIRSERGEWIYCDLPGKGLGWLPSGALEKIRLSRG